MILSRKILARKILARKTLAGKILARKTLFRPCWGIELGIRLHHNLNTFALMA
jgi:hypothetical protein